MDQIMTVLQPVIDTIKGLISGEIPIDQVIAMIQEALGGIFPA